MSDGAKTRLRDEVLAGRRRRDSGELENAGAALAAHVAAEPLFARARTVAVYLSMPTEPPTGPLIDALLAGGREVLVPVVADHNRLDWVALTAGTAPITSELGIPEPEGPRLGGDALARCDVVLVPALAADHAGHRLGRGAGYYDRALADVAVPVVAVVFTDELLADVPIEDHDVAVDAVLTPSGLFRVPRT